jgi:hypothetical protein
MTLPVWLAHGRGVTPPGTVQRRAVEPPPPLAYSSSSLWTIRRFPVTVARNGMRGGGERPPCPSDARRGDGTRTYGYEWGGLVTRFGLPVGKRNRMAVARTCQSYEYFHVGPAQRWADFWRRHCSTPRWKGELKSQLPLISTKAIC